jgi:hypothetical protein
MTDVISVVLQGATVSAVTADSKHWWQLEVEQLSKYLSTVSNDSDLIRLMWLPREEATIDVTATGAQPQPPGSCNPGKDHSRHRTSESTRGFSTQDSASRTPKPQLSAYKGTRMPKMASSTLHNVTVEHLVRCSRRRPLHLRTRSPFVRRTSPTIPDGHG